MVTLSFVATSLLILLTPGPTNTVLAASGAAWGVRRAILLPLAEALGYVVAISFFVVSAEWMQGNAVAVATVRLAAAAWLIYSAWRLWRKPFEADHAVGDGAFTRVMLTTIVNPKAMLVGTVLIPIGTGADVPAWVATYAALSTLAGLGWILLGSLMPLGVRRHAYRLAAVVLSGFSILALASLATTA